MRKIAIIGADAEEKLFFEHVLKRHDITLTFLPDMNDIDPQTDILSVFVSQTVTRQDIAKLPNLKLIACRSTGFNNIDLSAAKERKIAVANVPAYGGVTVAEYAVTLLLMLSRHMRQVLQQSTLDTPNREIERGMDLNGRTMGIIGTGAIGLGVAQIAKGLGMKVIGYDLYPRPQEAERIGFSYVDDVNMLLRASDVVTLHMPYTPENHHFLNAERLAKLRKGAIVINTARGELADTEALLEALNSGHLAAAGLDVVEDGYAERLSAMQNVIVTNHNAYNTHEAVERINQTSAENILNFIDEKEIHTV